jgi:flagellar protein FliO/FliZ
MAVVVAALGAGAWMWKRRKGAVQPERRPSLVITARQTIGVRSELLVVEIGGQSLLLGVTPGAIQRLAVLPDPVAEAAESLEPEPLAEPQEPEPVAETGRAANLRPPARAAARARVEAEREAPLEEQIRGLLRVRRGS